MTISPFVNQPPFQRKPEKEKVEITVTVKKYSELHYELWINVPTNLRSKNPSDNNFPTHTHHLPPENRLITVRVSCCEMFFWFNPSSFLDAKYPPPPPHPTITPAPHCQVNKPSKMNIHVLP